MPYQLPVEAFQVAEKYHLGRPMAVYHADSDEIDISGIAIIIGIWLVLTLPLFLCSAGFHVTDPLFIIVASIILLISPGIGIYLVTTRAMMKTMAVYVCI